MDSTVLLLWKEKYIKTCVVELGRLPSLLLQLLYQILFQLDDAAKKRATSSPKARPSITLYTRRT